jgi:hypothetical protein
LKKPVVELNHWTPVPSTLARRMPNEVVQDHLSATSQTVPPPPITFWPAAHLAATLLPAFESDTVVLVVR